MNLYINILLIFILFFSYCIGICICFDILINNKNINKVKAARLSLIWPIILLYYLFLNIFNIIFSYIKLILGHDTNENRNNTES